MINKLDDGGLVYPATRREKIGKHGGSATADEIPVYGDVTHPGITLRDYFAAHIAAGFMSAKPMHFNPDDDAVYFYKVADAMIAARKAGQP